MQETQLVKWNSIKAAITEIINSDIQSLTADDMVAASKMDCSLEAVQKWARQSKQSLPAQNEIAEYRLRLNRKQGEWIEANIPEEGGKPPLPAENSQLSRITLAEVGIDHNDSPKFRLLAKLPVDTFEEHIAKVKSENEELNTAYFCNLAKGKPHVSHSTGESEWYTPSIYIEAARQVMGSIDCDPASSKKANEIVKAATYFTKQTDGRKQVWHGNIWLNPPYTQPLVSEFCELLVKKYKEGEVQQACVLVNNATETNFFQEMLTVCSVVCFIKGRVKFVDTEGKESGAPLQGQAILYFGKQHQKFAEAFRQFGAILYADNQRKDS
jgi:hypothetical protein